MKIYQKQADSAIVTIQDMESAITLMLKELEKTRNLLYRAYIQNGSGLKNGELDCPDSMEFGILVNDNQGCDLQVTECSNIGLKSNFETIKQLLNEE